MGNITFEQLPQAVSILIEKVGQLTDKVEMALGKHRSSMTRNIICYPLKRSQPCLASPHPPFMQ